MEANDGSKRRRAWLGITMASAMLCAGVARSQDPGDARESREQLEQRVATFLARQVETPDAGQEQDTERRSARRHLIQLGYALEACEEAIVEAPGLGAQIELLAGVSELYARSGKEGRERFTAEVTAALRERLRERRATEGGSQPERERPADGPAQPIRRLEQRVNQLPAEPQGVKAALRRLRRQLR